MRRGLRWRTQSPIIVRASLPLRISTKESRLVSCQRRRFPTVVSKKNLRLQQPLKSRRTSGFVFQLWRMKQEASDNRVLSLNHEIDPHPTSGLSMVIRVLLDSITQRRSKLRAEVFKNLICLFLSITEHLPDHRPYTICISEGHRVSGWCFFESVILGQPPNKEKKVDLLFLTVTLKPRPIPPKFQPP